MKAYDPTLANPFRMDWLVPLDARTEDDYTRAVAERAPQLLRAARFVQENHLDDGTDAEVRVWVEAACGSACVSITWEPGPERFGFHLLDETLRERLGCVVFDEMPCVDAETSLGEMDLVLDAALRALRAADDDEDAAELAERVRHAETFVRVPVTEVESWDSGVEP